MRIIELTINVISFLIPIIVLFFQITQNLVDRFNFKATYMHIDLHLVIFIAGNSLNRLV